MAFLDGQAPFSASPRSTAALMNRIDSGCVRTVDRDELCRSIGGKSDLYSDPARENLQRLRRPDSVVVLTHVYPALFGGPAFQLFKCLTAIKLCEELNRRGLQAVPACRIMDESPPAIDKWSVRILNHESESLILKMEAQARADPLPRAAIAMLLAQAEASGRGNYDPDALDLLMESYGAETTLARATARFVSTLMKDWGIVVLDPDSFDFNGAAPRDAAAVHGESCSILPVLAVVVDPFEVESFTAGRRFPGAPGDVEGPTAWPQASATVIDGRNRRLMERYGLPPSRLYAGADVIVRDIVGESPQSTIEKLFELQLEAEKRIDALGAMDPEGGSFAKAASSGRKRIVYQLDHFREKFEASCANREQTIRRQIRKICNALAPNGRMQEWEMGGIQMILQHSRAILPILYDRLDILSSEHQLISMD